MWESTLDILDAGRTHRFTILHNQNQLRYADVKDRWQHDEDFRSFFISVLAGAPFQAYFWETPPVTRRTINQPFEFVLVDSPQLVNACPDPLAFKPYFESERVNDGIATFWNIGKDALLVVPCPSEELTGYPHMATFMRVAPEPQKHALLQHVGIALEQCLNEYPIGLSTSGLGIAWLHVRFDSYPKYYTFHPYRNK